MKLYVVYLEVSKEWENTTEPIAYAIYLTEEAAQKCVEEQKRNIAWVKEQGGWPDTFDAWYEIVEEGVIP